MSRVEAGTLACLQSRLAAEPVRPSSGGFAEDVAAVADALDFRRLVFVGHSLGGYEVAACAGLFPERLPGFVFLDHGGDPRNDSEADLAF